MWNLGILSYVKPRHNSIDVSQNDRSTNWISKTKCKYFMPKVLLNITNSNIVNQNNSEDRNISLTNTKSWAKNITTHKPSQHIISTINLSNIFNAIDQQSKNIQVPFPNPHSFKQPYIINIQPHTTAFALQASQTRKHVLWLCTTKPIPSYTN